jgi:hypothetical protein
VKQVKPNINQLVNILVHLVCISLLPAIAFASQQTDSSSGTHAGFAFLPFLVAYFARKRAVGGWLLLYYWSLYSGVLVSLIMNALSFSNFSPSLWPNSTRYAFVVVDTAISSIALYATAVVSTLLLFKKYRNLKMLSITKKLLLVGLVWSIVSLGLDFVYPAGDLMSLDVYSLVGSAVWYFYVLRSQRVQHVFVLQDFEVWYAISRTPKRAAT